MAETTVTRDRFVDVLRLVAMALVITQHWLMPDLVLDGDVLQTNNAWSTGVMWLVTWLSQVMPLVFFAGGAAAGLSLCRRRGDASWSARRLWRLAVPVIVLAAVWIPLTPLLTWLGLPAQPVYVGARFVGALLWFLALYSLITVLAPLLVRLAERLGGYDVAVLASGAVLVDFARFSMGLPTEFAYINAVLVWGAVHQVGVHYAAGRLHRVRGKNALMAAAAGFVVVALAVVAGPYPPSMIGMPTDAVSNMAPPTAVLLALATGQIGLALALRPTLLRWTAGGRAAGLIDRLSSRVMTAYVWHTPALVLVGGIALLGLGRSTPTPFSLDWLLHLPTWLGALSITLILAVTAFGRFERPAPRIGTATPWRVGFAALLVSGGMLVLTLVGFAPAAHFGPAGPLVATVAIMAGMVLLAPPRLGRSRHRAIPITQPGRVRKPHAPSMAIRSPAANGGGS